MALAYDNTLSPAAKATVNWGAITGTLASNSFSPAAGEVIVLVSSLEGSTSNTAACTMGTPTNTGTALTWHHVLFEQPAANSDGNMIDVWWAFTVGAQSGIVVSQTFSIGTGIIQDSLVAILLFTGANTTAPIGTFAGGSDGGTHTSPTSHAITPTAAGSILFLAAGDWSGTAAITGASSGTGSWVVASEFVSSSSAQALAMYGTSATVPTLTPNTSAITMSLVQATAPDWTWLYFEVLAAAGAAVGVPNLVMGPMR